jgi:formiminotetrahydrofolate cyclodeaminase
MQLFPTFPSAYDGGEAMGNIAALGNAVLTAIVSLMLFYYLKDRFEQVDRQFGQVHDELRQVRGELFQLAMALGVQQRPREV